MGKTADNYADWRLQENLRDYTFYFKRFKRLLVTMFNWQNLPNEISKRFLEDTLFYTGFVIFFRSKMGFYVVSKATAIGLNSYNEPIGYRAFSDSGTINEMVKAEDCVIIWNDYDRLGNSQNVSFFAKRISNIEKTIDNNLEQLKIPPIISCSEGQVETLKAMMAKSVNGQPWLLADEQLLNNIKLSVFNSDIKNYISDLEDTKHEIINEALTFFGINNVNVIKRERLVTGEAEQNNEQILLNRNCMLAPRIDAAKKINEKFALNISVDISLEQVKMGVSGIE